MSRKPTEAEIKEFTKVRKWGIRHPGNGSRVFEICSFAEMEYKWFEGFNLPFKVSFLFGIHEPFEKSNERITRYMELDYDSHVMLRNYRKQPASNYR